MRGGVAPPDHPSHRAPMPYASRRLPTPRRVLPALASLAALAASLAACSADPLDPTSVRAMVITSGNNQTVPVGGATNPLVVTVYDQTGSPRPGSVVTFAIQSGGGSLGATAVTTGNDGQASTTYTAGTTTGPVVVAASVAGLRSPVTFVATIAPRP